VMFNELPSEFR